MILHSTALLLMPAAARAPISASEKLLVSALVLVGLVLTACLLPSLARNLRYLDGRKRPRGERGRALLAQMDGACRFAGGGQTGLSLRGRDLRGEDLRDAFLDDVDLSDTDLRGVDLSGASLDGTHLVGARYDAATRWPAGFDPAKLGAVRVR
jgi:hypothetical protein